MAAVLGAAAMPGAVCFGQEDRIELNEILKDRSEALKSELEKAEPGDKREFTVSTDDNISALEIGDIYVNNSTFFRVITIPSKGTSGGKFVIQRTAGKAEPGQKWTRVSGMGPVTIASTRTLLDYYWDGGLFMHPIAVLGFCMIILIVNSLWIYRRRRHCSPAFVETASRLLDKGDLRRFEDLSLRQEGLFPAICRALVDRFATGDAEEIRSHCEIVAAAHINRLRIPVKALNLIAAAAPLMGLLGTIVGMVMVFESVASARDAQRAQALAAGIRVKLFCTTMALCVAIPALLAFFIFNQKLGLIVAECELLTEEFLHKVALLKQNGGALASRPRRDSPDADEDDEAAGHQQDSQRAGADREQGADQAEDEEPRRPDRKPRKENRP